MVHINGLCGTEEECSYHYKCRLAKITDLPVSMSTSQRQKWKLILVGRYMENADGIPDCFISFYELDPYEIPP